MSPDDLDELAASIVEEAAKADDAPGSNPELEKNPHAVALGRLGGKKGGPARAKALTAKERRDAARHAAQIRWQRERERAGATANEGDDA